MQICKRNGISVRLEKEAGEMDEAGRRKVGRVHEAAEANSRCPRRVNVEVPSYAVCRSHDECLFSTLTRVRYYDYCTGPGGNTKHVMRGICTEPILMDCTSATGARKGSKPNSATETI